MQVGDVGPNWLTVGNCAIPYDIQVVHGVLTLPRELPEQLLGRPVAVPPLRQRWAEVKLGETWLRPRKGGEFTLLQVQVDVKRGMAVKEWVTLRAGQVPHEVTVGPGLGPWRDDVRFERLGDDDPLGIYARDVLALEEYVASALDPAMEHAGVNPTVWIEGPAKGRPSFTVHLRCYPIRGPQLGRVVESLASGGCEWARELRPCADCHGPTKLGRIAAALDGIGIDPAVAAATRHLAHMADEPPF